MKICSQIHSSWLGDIVDSGIGLSYSGPQATNYSPSQGLWIFLLFSLAEIGNWLLPPTHLLNQQRKRFFRPHRENKDKKRGKRGSHYRCVNWRRGAWGEVLQIDISEAWYSLIYLYSISCFKELLYCVGQRTHIKHRNIKEMPKGSLIWKVPMMGPITRVCQIGKRAGPTYQSTLVSQ